MNSGNKPARCAEDSDDLGDTAAQSVHDSIRCKDDFAEHRVPALWNPASRFRKELESFDCPDDTARFEVSVSG